MAKRDYYEILGLDLNCNPQDIRKSYRNLALKWHPDKHIHKKEAASKFNEIHEAYTVLTNAQQRKIYDQYGHAGLQRFIDGEDHTNHENIYFTKGFQGTDKSAFEILCDILFERDEESSFQNERAANPQKDSQSNFEAFMNEQFFNDDDEFEFLSNYTPTFHDPSFMFGLPLFGQQRSPSTSTKISSSQNESFVNKQDVRQPNSRGNVDVPTQQAHSNVQFYGYGNQQGNSYNIYNPTTTNSFIVIDDDNNTDYNDEYEAFNAHQNPNANPFMSELNQFQDFLDEFHKTIEGSLNPFEKINSASKKILKREKMGKSTCSTKKETTKGYTMSSVPIYS